MILLNVANCGNPTQIFLSKAVTSLILFHRQIFCKGNALGDSLSGKGCSKQYLLDLCFHLSTIKAGRKRLVLVPFPMNCKDLTGNFFESIYITHSVSHKNLHFTVLLHSLLQFFLLDACFSLSFTVLLSFFPPLIN